MPSRRSGRVAVAALVAYAAFFVGLTVLVTPAVGALAGRLGRRPVPDFLLGAAIGVLPLAPLLALMRRVRTRGRRAWFGVPAVLTGVALALALGQLPPRGGEDAWDRAHLPYVPPGAAFGMLVTLIGFVAYERGDRMAWAVVKRPAAEPRPGHRTVSILDVRPGPDESWLGYYVAACECGWTGTQYPDEWYARREAAAHAPGVEPVTVPMRS